MSIDEDQDLEDYPVSYSIDNAILMHREAHFGGNFATMIDYYKKEGKGISKDFDIPRIQKLYETEQKTENNLAPLMLSGLEAEKISRAKQSYKELRDIYEIQKPKSPFPRLIADLILAEDEETLDAIQAVVAQKGAIAPALIELLRSEDFHDPLFPGYGQAPALAAQCLGLIGDKRAIIALFESIGNSDFFDEDIVLNALHAIGQPAKEFLLTVLHGHPITSDNEQAVVALINFKNDPEVSSACLRMLQEIDLGQHASLATYLALACEGLPASLRPELTKIGELPTTPKILRQDINIIAKNWKNELTEKEV